MYYVQFLNPVLQINPEPEKPKGRFSSKYRGAPNIDRPAYKATVPTVTPSTVSVLVLHYFINAAKSLIITIKMRHLKGLLN